MIMRMPETSRTPIDLEPFPKPSTAIGVTVRRVVGQATTQRPTMPPGGINPKTRPVVAIVTVVVIA